MTPEEVDRVYFINLLRRKDRLIQFLNGTDKIDWPFPHARIIEAIDGRQVPAPYGYAPGAGAWGCFRSHQNAIEHALSNGGGHTLILEDDATFGAAFGDRVRRFLAQVPDHWQQIRLGGVRPPGMPMEPRIVAPGVVRERQSLLTHAYMIHRDHLAEFYRMMSRAAMASHSWDVHQAGTQRDYWVYGPWPDYLANQRDREDSDTRR